MRNAFPTIVIVLALLLCACHLIPAPEASIKVVDRYRKSIPGAAVVSWWYPDEKSNQPKIILTNYTTLSGTANLVKPARELLPQLVRVSAPGYATRSLGGPVQCITLIASVSYESLPPLEETSEAELLHVCINVASPEDLVALAFHAFPARDKATGMLKTLSRDPGARPFTLALARIVASAQEWPSFARFAQRPDQWTHLSQHQIFFPDISQDAPPRQQQCVDAMPCTEESEQGAAAVALRLFQESVRGRREFNSAEEIVSIFRETILRHYESVQVGLTRCADRAVLATIAASTQTRGSAKFLLKLEESGGKWICNGFWCYFRAIP